MLVAIYAYENLYGGLHGIDSHLVLDVSSIEEAYVEARLASREVIESFGLTEELFEGIEEDDYEKMIGEDIAYEIFEVIDPEIIALYNKDSDEVNEMFCQHDDIFITKYCKEL